MSRLRRALPWVGILLVLAGVGLLAAFPDAVGRLRGLTTLSAQADPACDLGAGPCPVRFADGVVVEVALEPRPPVAGLPLRFAVSGPDLAGAEAVEIAGLSMNMGLTRVPLAPAGPGAFAGQGSLPVCSSSRMEWRVDALVTAGGRPRVASVRFVTGGR